MISATELRKHMSDIVKQDMAKIERDVTQAAEKGMLKVSVPIRDGFDYSGILKELCSLGYQASIKQHPGDFRDPGYRTIEVSW